MAASTLAVVVAAGTLAPAMARGHRGGDHSEPNSSRPTASVSAVPLTAEQQTYVDALIAARNTYRASVRLAEVNYKLAKRDARATFLAAKAIAVTDADRTAARDTYETALATAKAVKVAARQQAAQVRSTAVAAAATAYTAATGLDAATIPVPFGKSH